MNGSEWIQFEDDYFETKEGKIVQDNRNYIPAICYPKCFFEQNESDTAESLQSQANYCYWIKNYAHASSLYERVLNEFFSNSPFMKRNLLESVARCQFKLGNLDKARCLAEECLLLSYTVELKSSILDLLINIYGSLCLWNMQKNAYLQLISYHPYNYRLWWDLSKCISLSQKSDQKEKNHNTMMEAACLIRVWTIVKTMRIKEIESLMPQIEEKLNSLSLPENFIATGKQFFSKDLVEEYEVTDEPKDLSNSDFGEDNLKEEPKNYENKWFKWISNFSK